MYCPVAFVAGVTTHFYCFSLSKNYCFWQPWHAWECIHPWDTTNACQAVLSSGICGRSGITILLLLLFHKLLNMTGSSGMLEDAPTSETQQMSVRQYCPQASVEGVATHFYCFSLSSKNYWISFWQLWHAWECTLPWDTTNVSQTVLSYGKCGMARMDGITILLLLHFQKSQNTLLAALACSKIDPPIRYYKCESGSTVLWHLWQGWQDISIASPFPKIIIYGSGSSGLLENTPTPEI